MEGELQENFEKDTLFYEGTQKLQKIMNTALLSQGRFSRIVDSCDTAPFKSIRNGEIFKMNTVFTRISASPEA